MTGEEFRKEWIKALRSGDYKQGTGQLRSDNDEYCCLGVACNLLPQCKWVSRRDIDGTIIWHAVTGRGAYNYGQLNHPEIIGLSQAAQNALIELNDDLSFTFSEIADVLESGMYDEVVV